MDSPKPSRSRRRGAVPSRPAAPAAVAPGTGHLVTLAAREDAPPFAVPDGKGFALTARGRALAACWKSLGRGRPALAVDALAVLPHGVEGILRLDPAAGGAALAEAVRLFKVISALRMARGSAGDTVSPARPLWRKGFGERPLEGPEAIAAARRELRGRGARGA